MTLSVASCLALTGCPSDDIGDTGVGDDTDTGDTEESTESTDDEVGTEDSSTGTTEEETTEEETTGETTEEETTEEETADETTEETTEEETETGPPPAECGNGVVEGDEACDDANDDNTDDCLDDCTAASCGDGFIQAGVEACDDGVNDGAYGGCNADCTTLAAYCGDGEVNGPEDCDDANLELNDGCLDTCTIPESCLTIIDYDDMAMSGPYLIAPAGYDGEPFEVHCEMEADGGGYTFLKVDAGAQQFAQAAEAECAMWGMQLWIPRSLEHKNAGWAIANDAGIGDGANPDYMRILGIYPDQNGATCNLQPMNSDNPNCNWGASDGGPWYVHEVTNINEPNGDNSTTGSMFYTWFANGDINHHNDIPGNGYSSQRYMCDVGDKTP
ncbi:putative lipoprotein [Plesiocystis pacifica SIR-1]|uniref:Putative lipoprotein n=1 Tax=Plesiocystis pacifica SIR-1 TaxID=391625 RepID=A6GAC3_9BACT|nr:putative lipoprotein [Plesiocystis pacifica SIR-1]